MYEKNERTHAQVGVLVLVTSRHIRTRSKFLCKKCNILNKCLSLKKTNIRLPYKNALKLEML